MLQASMTMVYIHGAILGLISLMGGLLYVRWSNPLYYRFTAFFLLACIIQIAVPAFHILYLEYATLVSASFTLAGLYCLLRPRHQKMMKVFVGCGALFLISGILLYCSFESTTLIYGIIGISFCLLYAVLARQLPKQNHIYTLLGIYVFCFISFIVAWATGKPIFRELAIIVALVGCAYVFILIFSRIIDIMQTVSYSSVTDGLTKLLNKHYFKNKVHEAIDNGSAKAIIFADIDNFKQLNDTQGHHIGDEILKLVGQILKDVVNDYGLCGRYGGEEMVALVTSDVVNVASMAERFRIRVETESKSIFPVTVSVGYALHHSSVKDADTLIKQADIAMYEAKAQGKNRVVEYNVVQDDKS